MKLTYIIANNTNPYENLALEEYLLRNTDSNECILYLWQTHKTVVIGYNQNAWKECKVESLKSDGGNIARRPSGGGAVYQDSGNLNFTFLMRKDFYDLRKQSEVILMAANKFGIPAQWTGRNDITVEEKKFSGNAFYQAGDYCYHHGTILINADKEEMSRYLNTSMKKLQAKGVSSVRSRVCNLTEYNPKLTIESMKNSLIEAFGEIYQAQPIEMDTQRIRWEEVRTLAEKLSGWDWIFGREIPFNTQWEHRFDWGELQIHLSVIKGIINEVQVWTDSMEVEFSKLFQDALKGCRLSKQEIRQALFTYKEENNKEYNMMMESIEFFLEP